MKNRLAELRSKIEKTQEELADDFSLSVDIIKKYENMECGTNIPIERAKELSQKYKVSLDWLYGQSEMINEQDILARTLGALSKAFKLKHKTAHNEFDTVLLINRKFSNFIGDMNKLVEDYLSYPNISKQMYIEKAKLIYEKNITLLTTIYGNAPFDEDNAIEIHEIASMDGFVFDGNFFEMLGAFKTEDS